jgi:hypothetical protein
MADKRVAKAADCKPWPKILSICIGYEKPLEVHIFGCG